MGRFFPIHRPSSSVLQVCMGTNQRWESQEDFGGDSEGVSWDPALFWACANDKANWRLCCDFKEVPRELGEQQVWSTTPCLPVMCLSPMGCSSFLMGNRNLDFRARGLGRVLKKWDVFLRCCSSASAPLCSHSSKRPLCSGIRAEITAHCRCEWQWLSPTSSRHE